MRQTLAAPQHHAPRPKRPAPLAASSADEAWLRMDRPENRMVITAVMRMARPLTEAELKALITAKLLRHPRFRHPLQRRHHRPPDGDGALDLTGHVHSVRLAEAGGRALSQYLAQLMKDPLRHDEPLWQVYRVTGPEGSTTLVWRIHHALADGIALLRVLLDAADTPAPVPSPLALAERRTSWRVLRGGYSLLKLLLLPPDHRTSLKNALTGRKQVAFSDALPLDRVKRIAHASGAKVNDVLLSALASGLHAQLAAHRQRARNLRAIIPVDLRQGATDESLGNRFGLVFLTLPVGRLSAQARLAGVVRRMNRIKHQPEAAVAFRILEVLGAISSALATLAVLIFGAKASLVVTNVAGPTQAISLEGDPVDDILFWVPQAGGIGLGVSLFSYAGKVRLGVVADDACLVDPAAVVAGFATEIDRLESGRG